MVCPGGAGVGNRSSATRTATASTQATEAVHFALLGRNLSSVEGTEVFGVSSSRRDIAAAAARRPPPTAYSRGRPTPSTLCTRRTSTPGVLQLLPSVFPTTVRPCSARCHGPSSTWLFIASTSRGCWKDATEGVPATPCRDAMNHMAEVLLPAIWLSRGYPLPSNGILVVQPNSHMSQMGCSSPT